MRAPQVIIRIQIRVMWTPKRTTRHDIHNGLETLYRGMVLTNKKVGIVVVLLDKQQQFVIRLFGYLHSQRLVNLS